MGKRIPNKVSTGQKVFRYLKRFSFKTLESVAFTLIAYAIFTPHIKAYILKSVSRQLPSIIPPPDPFIVRILKPLLWVSFWSLSVTMVSFGVFFAVRYILMSHDFYPSAYIHAFFKEIRSIMRIEYCQSFDIYMNGILQENIPKHGDNTQSVSALLRAYHKYYHADQTVELRCKFENMDTERNSKDNLGQDGKDNSDNNPKDSSDNLDNNSDGSLEV